MKDAVAVGSLFFVALFVVGAAWYAFRVYQQLIDMNGSQTLARDKDRGYWEDERRRALHNLKEVQFDFDTGKIDQADFDSLRVRYESRALEAMDQLASLPQRQEST